jgi:cell division protein FtsI/penicillin-binding protein 2
VESRRYLSREDETQEQGFDRTEYCRMPHTSPVRKYFRWMTIAAAFGFLTNSCISQQLLSWQGSVDRAASTAPNARIVVLDVKTGRLLATHRLNEAARTLAAPGSTLKPLVLYGLIAAGRWNPATRVACDRGLVVAGHRLACTHPASAPFNAREALTWSCNSYFATVARTLEPGELGRLLRPSGLLSVTGLANASGRTPEEASAEFREPRNVDAMQLALLGVEGVRVTPLEMATAYRWLALQLDAHPDSDAARIVRAGLEDSASFGMAGEASHGGVPVAGKTGTAESAGSDGTHGWFTGFSPLDRAQTIVTVYLPSGRGTDAARVAGEVLAHARQERR